MTKRTKKKRVKKELTKKQKAVRLAKKAFHPRVIGNLLIAAAALALLATSVLPYLL